MQHSVTMESRDGRKISSLCQREKERSKKELRRMVRWRERRVVWRGERGRCKGNFFTLRKRERMPSDFTWNGEKEGEEGD